MNESISICIASYNTLSTRKEGLDACLEGLKKSISYFQSKTPNIDVVVSWVDDASTDSTWEYVSSYFLKNNIKNVIEVLRVNSHQGYCRNLAAKLVDSDYIMFCDSDDVFLENHIQVCYEVITHKDSAKRHLAWAHTTAYMDPALKIHKEWVPLISQTIPITKILRRDVWEFLEGFPVNDLYKITGCEDQDWMMLANYFFLAVGVTAPTVEYRCYPGSFFETQLDKFQKPLAEAKPCPREEAHKELHRIRRLYIEQRLEYLKHKICNTDWYEKLEKVSTKYI